MKWKVKPDLKHHEKRTIKKFLFLPLQIGLEKRWLEVVRIKQIYHLKRNGMFTTRHWENLEFIKKL